MPGRTDNSSTAALLPWASASSSASAKIKRLCAGHVSGSASLARILRRLTCALRSARDQRSRNSFRFGSGSTVRAAFEETPPRRIVLGFCSSTSRGPVVESGGEREDDCSRSIFYAIGPHLRAQGIDVQLGLAKCRGILFILLQVFVGERLRRPDVDEFRQQDLISLRAPTTRFHLVAKNNRVLTSFLVVDVVQERVHSLRRLARGSPFQNIPGRVGERLIAENAPP